LHPVANRGPSAPEPDRPRREVGEHVAYPQCALQRLGQHHYRIITGAFDGGRDNYWFNKYLEENPGQAVPGFEFAGDVIEAGKAVTTIEAADRHPVLGEVQKVFVALQAAQCGYCTNGIMMTLAGLLSQSPRPDRAHILAHLDERHLCRCGVHARVLKAIDRLLAYSEGGLA
jgi:hypothetical protein